MKTAFLIAVMTALYLSGCSSKILMPYEEEPLCKLKPGQGMCGSVSQVYKRSEKMVARDD